MGNGPANYPCKSGKESKSGGTWTIPNDNPGCSQQARCQWADSTHGIGFRYKTERMLCQHFQAAALLDLPLKHAVVIAKAEEINWSLGVKEVRHYIKSTVVANF